MMGWQKPGGGQQGRRFSCLALGQVRYEVVGPVGKLNAFKKARYRPEASHRHAHCKC